MLSVPSHTCSKGRVKTDGEASVSGGCDEMSRYGAGITGMEADELPARVSRWARWRSAAGTSLALEIGRGSSKAWRKVQRNTHGGEEVGVEVCSHVWRSVVSGDIVSHPSRQQSGGVGTRERPS